MTGEALEPDCPYVGLAPFEAAHAPYFFGRTLDATVLADNVLARQIVVFYGASGVGKSSLLNVGLPTAFTQLSPTVQIASRSNWYEPAGLKAWLDELTARASKEPARPLVIVLDQFEEFFLYTNGEQVKSFAKSLAGLISRADIEIHLLFSLREDGLHRLDALRIDLPNLFETTLELRHLDETAVREAIERPVAVWNQRHGVRVTVDEDFATVLLDQLRPQSGDGGKAKAGRVELAYLQLALEQIWEAEGGTDATALRTATLIERLRGVSEISRRHVEDVLRTLGEGDQGICATVFDRLVTPSGGKILYGTTDLAAVARVTPERMDDVLSRLSRGKARLLRAVELPGRTHTRGYEILHDILARPILDWREHRVARLERERADAEARARQQAEDDRSRLARMRNGLVVVVVMLAVAAGLAIWAMWRASAAEGNLRDNNLRAHALRLLSDAQSILSRGGEGGDERALLELVASTRLARMSEVDSALLSELVSPLRKVVPTGPAIEAVATNPAIEAVAVSPDGQRIASVGARTVRLWNATSGEAIGPPLTAHYDGVITIAFSPDGRWMASGSSGATVLLWDAKTDQPIGMPLVGHEGAVTSVAFSPDSMRVVSASVDTTLRFWDVSTGKPVGSPLKGHAESVLSVAFSPGGDRIVSGSADATIRMWRADNGQPIGRPIPGQRAAVTRLAFSADGRLLLSGSADRTMRLWDVQSGQPAAVMCSTTEQSVGVLCPKHSDVITSVSFSRDGRLMASASADGTIRLWDGGTGNSIEPALSGHEQRVTSIAFDADGRVVSGSLDGTLRVWDAASPAERSLGIELGGHGEAVWDVAFGDEGRRIVSGGRDRTVRLWDAASRKEIGKPMTGHTESVTSVAFSPDHRLLASGSGDRTLRRWDAETGMPVGEPSTGHTDSLLSVAFSPNGRRIASAGADGSIRLWDAATGQPVGSPLMGHVGAVLDVAFSSDSSRLASGGADGTMRIWDTGTGQSIGAPLTGHQGNVSSVAFSPDDGRIVSAGADQTIRIWNMETGKSPLLLSGHKEPVSGAVFSPDGRLIVSGSADGTLRVWDSTTGRPVWEPLTGHKAGVRRIAISPDGRRIVSASEDAKLRLWPGPAAWPDAICDKLVRNMTSKLWDVWVSPELEYASPCPRVSAESQKETSTQ